MYQKEIVYMNLFENDIKVSCVGYLKLERKQENYNIELQVKNVPTSFTGNFPIRLQGENGWKEADTLSIQGGNGKWVGSMSEAVMRAEILLTDSQRIKGESKNVQTSAAISARQEAVQGDNKKEKEVKEPSPEISKAELEIRKQPSTSKSLNKPSKVESPSLHESKWEQLLVTYEQIHPYGDNRVYIKLEPKDFVVLRSNCQHLVNNSFLLHGFYNYRYVILGKEKDFYIGVPGVFYEREKMVALMFGFEAFECEGGNAEEGKFGYYLRKVEI